MAISMLKWISSCFSRSLSLSLSPVLTFCAGFKSPSKIQRLAIPQILSGGNVVVAAETGSGKTLSYLIPLVQRLKQEEASSIINDSRCSYFQS